MRMVLGHSRRLTLVGIVLGVAGGVRRCEAMEQVLFGSTRGSVIDTRVGDTAHGRRVCVLYRLDARLVISVVAYEGMMRERRRIANGGQQRSGKYQVLSMLHRPIVRLQVP